MTHALTAWFLETMVATTLLIAGVLLLRGPVANFFGPRAAYLLWAAPALRMILPPLPSDWISPGTTGFQNVAVVLAGTSSLTRQATVAAEGSAAWPLVLAILWLGGAALFFAQHLLSYARFTRAVRERATPMFEQGRIKVASSEYVASPIAFGVFGKSIIVPIDFTHRFDATEQRLALSHETIHHHRGDLIVNLAALAMLALHWFNPLAHFAHRAFRLDQEAACDDLVLAKSDAAERRAYGTALYKSATGGVPLAICAMGTTSQLKSRLRQIVAERSPAGARAGGMITVMLVLVGLASTASGSVAAPLSVATPDAPRMLALGGVVLEPTRLAAHIPAPPKPQRAPTAPTPLSPRHLVAPPSPPEAPAAPEAPQAPQAPEPPAPPALKMASANCSDGTRPAIFSQSITINGGESRRMAILICGHGPTQALATTFPGRDRMVAALIKAKAELSDDEMMLGTPRDALIEMIDQQIARLSAPAPFPAS